MAAKLKKRALAEFSHVVTEEPPQPVKKLRLVQRASAPSPSISINLAAAKSSQEVLFLLLKLESNIPSEKEGADTIYAELSEHLTREQDSIVRCKIISMFSRLALVPGFNALAVCDYLLNQTGSEKSDKVLSQLFLTAKSVSQVLSSSSPYIKRFMRAAFSNVSHADHNVRSSCLQLIGRLASCESQRKDTPASPDWPVSIQELLTRYIMDPDPRVRGSAFEAMLSLHNSDQPLEHSVYQQACSALSDDYEGVRLAAIQLIWVLAHHSPESMVPVNNSTEELRMVDDAFAKICNMVTDISVKVRIRACQLLGSLHLVSPKFLEQTLDKKIMSQLRRKRTAHERAREHFSSGEWSTGQKWADDAPKEDIDPDSVNLLSIGACGAFIHGLEDEFLEVRNAAVDSLCELATQHPQFSVLSQDSVIDMFNDEIESVRINAINSLRKMCDHLELREDQAETILGVLQDFSPVSRETLRELLGCARLATKTGLNNCVMALLDNLRRYPQDRLSVWRCAQRLGLNHASHTLALVPDLLCLHPFFDTPEPDMDDPAYIAVLLLVFNAASVTSSMVPLFPEHTRRHYLYLRSSLPTFVPILKSLELSKDESSMAEVSASSSSSRLDPVQFVEQLTTQLKQVDTMAPSAAVAVLEVAVRDLETSKQLESGVSAMAECTGLYLQTQLILTKLLIKVNDVSECIVDKETVTAAVDKIFQLCTKLQTLYLGLPSDVIWSVRQLELKALTLNMVLTLSQGTMGQKEWACHDFKKFFDEMKMSIEEEPSVVLDPLTSHLLTQIDRIDSSNQQAIHKVLQSSLPMLRPASLTQPLYGVRRVTAILEEPVDNQEKPVKMAAGLTAGITVVATLENVTDVQAVRIQVKYPDQQSQLIQPPSSAWTRLSPLRHRLHTEVIMSHALWSDSCSVEISLVLEPCGQAKDWYKKPEMVQLTTPPVKQLVNTKPHK